DMMDSAIKGMVDSLGDPYTVYMDQNEFYDFNLRSKGNYVGIGIQVAPKEGKIFIISVFKNSPAEKSGIRAGDYIINVSNENVYEDSIDRAISLIKGEEGSSVNLTVEREGKHIQFNVNREKIDVMPVEYEKITEDILYIKINSFDENSSKGVNEALISSNYRGIILDLRGNPGGLLNECVDIASQFIPEGKVIVSMDDKYGNREFINAKKGIAEDKEIVVLGDSGSASASEVLIGALKDHNRAIFVGETTFGKGLVQRVFELGDGSGVKVTVSKYYTPSEEYINKVGIHPNVEVIYSQDEILRHKQMSNGDYVKMRELDPQYIKALEILKENISS
ncbi:Carboxyl-terminal protease, partial [Candidatus Arthromitus sp. SFB-5]